MTAEDHTIPEETLLLVPVYICLSGYQSSGLCSGGAPIHSLVRHTPITALAGTHHPFKLVARHHRVQPAWDKQPRQATARQQRQGLRLLSSLKPVWVLVCEVPTAIGGESFLRARASSGVLSLESCDNGRRGSMTLMDPFGMSVLGQGRD